MLQICDLRQVLQAGLAHATTTHNRDGVPLGFFAHLLQSLRQWPYLGLASAATIGDV